ncbi:hypothetical protein EC957_009290 [Mortierella hygrophila]|uniref:C2H2-type domain-containing protein n=1 Tax=Mortierella hygrophila TaxID=979708 RepID=A0A9P6FC31_9FUNG|nr:hypothetical protein EC957_009290 [Mortierella hygrophila]
MALSFSKENSVLSFTKGSATAEAQQQLLPSQAHSQTPTAAAAPAPAPPAREPRDSIQLPFRDFTQSYTATTTTTPAQGQQQAQVHGLIRSPSDYTHDRKRVKQGMRYSCLVPGCRIQFQNKNQLDSHIWVCREVNKNKIATGEIPDVVMTVAGSVKAKKEEEEDDVMIFHNDSINRARSSNKAKSTGRLGGASSDEGESGAGSGETRAYPCSEPDCTSSYTSLESLARHRTRHTSITTGGKLPCTWSGCDKILATTKSLKDHLQIHAERDAGIQLECPVPGCGKIFGTRRCLRAHELRCKQVKSGERLPCPIEGCKATFGSTDYVRRHVLDHEKGLIGVEFRCDYPDCKSILANPLTLQRHKQLHEEQALGFEWKCLVDGCGKVYSGSKQLTDHQSRIHKDLSPLYQFACPYNQCREMFDCQRSAYKHGCLNERLQSQPPSSSFNAPVATTVSASVPSAPSVSSPPPSSLFPVKVQSSRPKIPCTMEGCMCELSDQEELDSHLWMHNTLKTRPPYPCFEEGCSMVFDNKQDILSHTLTH